MIIKRMRATFGKLEDRELQLQPGLNLISGGNEAGKTTWLAFLLAMLYGVDTRDRVRGERIPDKLKYQPWSGKPMSGTLELSTADREITLERSSLNGPMSDFRAWDSRTGSNLEDLTGKTCGQTLLGVEAAVYARSAYLRQQRISVSADAQLEKRLSGLVTAGSEDYAYGEIDEKLKKLQTALRHNQSGALPRAEARSLELQRRLDEMEDSRQRLSALEESLRELRAQREECRAVLAALDSLDRQERQERVNAAEEALSAAVEDREGWQSVCADLPPEELLQNLEAELNQLQADLQKAALEEGLSPEELELPGPDPVFGRMSAKEAHDKAVNDANLVKNAKAEPRPKRKRSFLWLALALLGLGLGFYGALLPALLPVAIGVPLALTGLGIWFGMRIAYNRRKDAYMALQKQCRAVLEQYETSSAKGVVLRGMRYIRSLEELELEPDGGVSRERLAELADRRNAILTRLEAVMPGCGTPEKAAILFREAEQSRQALARAEELELQRSEQLRDLKFALGEAVQADADAARYAGRDREAETQRLEALEQEIERTASQADKLAGALGQMGDPMELRAELDALGQEMQRMEQRYAALQLARQALHEADESLRAKFSPLLCEKTGALFSRLTDGKYDQIRLDRNLHVTVHPVDSPVFRPLSYLSGGTVDQLYLALRLAICELLIPEAPIVLDDALVFFDDKRAELALRTLRELADSRQVLIFTCQSRERQILDRLAAERKAARSAAAGA